MAKRPMSRRGLGGKEPAPPSARGSRSTSSKAERKREAKREATRAAELRKRELAKISRQMSRPPSRRTVLWIVGSLSSLLLIGAIGYAVYAYFSVNAFRRGFLQAYRDTDLLILKTYTPESLDDVEEWKQKAKEGSVLFQTSDVRKYYRQAVAALQDAHRKAAVLQSRYDEINAKLGQLREEALERSVDRYAPKLWKQVDDLVAGLGKPGSARFDPNHAIARLSSAAQLLQKIRAGSFAAIKEYGAALEAFSEFNRQRTEAEWDRNLPDKAAAVNVIVARATAAMQSQNWRDAATEYRAAIDILRASETILADLRNATRARVEQFRAAIARADADDLAANASSNWAQVLEHQDTAVQALARYEYTAAVEAAKEGAELLDTVEEKVAAVKTTGAAKRETLEATFLQLAEEATLLRKNWPEEWAAVQEAREEIPKLERARDYVELLDRVDQIQEQLDSLLAKRRAVAAALATVKAELLKLDAANSVPLLRVNYPDKAVGISAQLAEASRAETRGDLREAVAALSGARDALREVQQDLSDLEAKATQELAQLQQRRRAFSRGISGFGDTDLRLVDALLERAQACHGRTDYQRTIQLLTRL